MQNQYIQVKHFSPSVVHRPAPQLMLFHPQLHHPVLWIYLKKLGQIVRYTQTAIQQYLHCSIFIFSSVLLQILHTNIHPFTGWLVCEECGSLVCILRKTVQFWVYPNTTTNLLNNVKKKNKNKNKNKPNCDFFHTHSSYTNQRALLCLSLTNFLHKTNHLPHSPTSQPNQHSPNYLKQLSLLWTILQRLRAVLALIMPLSGMGTAQDQNFWKHFGGLQSNSHLSPPPAPPPPPPYPQSSQTSSTWSSWSSLSDPAIGRCKEAICAS